MDVGGRIPDRRDRSEAIRQGCTELVKNGRFEVAEELSNRYLSRYENAALLIATTAAWLNSGRLDRARRWVRACIVNSNYGGRKELSDCLRLFVEAGQSDEAVSLANEIPTASDRAAVLRNIAISISPAADPRVLSTLELALQAIAVAQPSGMLLDESLDALRQDIARILVRHGQWDRALDSAEKIDDLGIRLTTMVEIAAALPADRAQSAKEIVSSTEARLSAVGSDPRARIHGSLGVIYARWRDFAKSRSAVEECHLATEKLKACTAIVREYRAATASVVNSPT
jgi:tetratricopeptide (TPR) repeat protein